MGKEEGFRKRGMAAADWQGQVMISMEWPQG